MNMQLANTIDSVATNFEKLSQRKATSLRGSLFDLSVTSIHQPEFDKGAVFKSAERLIQKHNTNSRDTSLNYELEEAVFKGSARMVNDVQNRPTWAESLKEKLEEFQRLQFGWDGPGSIPVIKENANLAKTLLERLFKNDFPVPSVFPIGDGTLQIEWHYGEKYLEFEIISENEVNAFWRDNSTNEEREELLSTEPNNFGPWLDLLTR